MELNPLSKKTDERKRVKFFLKRFMMLLAVIVAAIMTFNACIEDDNEGDENGNNGNGNSGGGVSGKRLKTLLIEYEGNPLRGEYSYNSDGSLKRVDWYDKASKLVSYDVITNNPDGTIAKLVATSLVDNSNAEMTYFYDFNKKPVKAEGTASGVPYTYTWTFQNGRLIRHVQTYDNFVITYEPDYDSQGRRTTTIETHNVLGKCQYTRTYNSDGTLKRVDVTNYSNFPLTKGHIEIFTWENGKTTYNDDDHRPY